MWQSLLSLANQSELILAAAAVSAFTVENDCFVDLKLAVTGQQLSYGATDDGTKQFTRTALGSCEISTERIYANQQTICT